MKSVRGALIVFEGCDRCGKTTQCKKLVDFLISQGLNAELISFPARHCPSGRLINDYLTHGQDLSDEGVHLLFTLNRWEAKQTMQRKLQDGITLIVDRYSYSGIAFSAAKGLPFEWCKAPESGLLQPDLVLYLTAPLDELSMRHEYGSERYERLEFQQQVQQAYKRIYTEEMETGNKWREINADQRIADVQRDINAIVLQTLADDIQDKPLKLLWS